MTNHNELLDLADFSWSYTQAGDAEATPNFETFTVPSGCIYRVVSTSSSTVQWSWIHESQLPMALSTIQNLFQSYPTTEEGDYQDFAAWLREQ